MRAIALVAVIGSLGLLVPAVALGVGAKSSIEEGLPLTIESAYPIEYLGREFQLITRYERGDEGVDSVLVEPRLEFGIWWNTELTVSVPFLFGEIEPDGIRPVRLELLYNLNQETLRLPAFSIVGGVDLPTGEDTHGVDPLVKLIVTRTLGKTWKFHQMHLNVAYQWNDDRQSDERSGRYAAAIGYSALLNVDTVFLIDFVREQEFEDNVELNLLEAGVRYQLTPRAVLSGGIGFGIGDESPDVRLTLGIQWEL